MNMTSFAKGGFADYLLFRVCSLGKENGIAGPIVDSVAYAIVAYAMDILV